MSGEEKDGVRLDALREAAQVRIADIEAGRFQRLS
jgi:hypothetical protein